MWRSIANAAPTSSNSQPLQEKSRAIYQLALLHLDGEARPRDAARAAELLRPAAAADNADAQYTLATLYMSGDGVPQDDAAAAELLASAARLGHIDAEVEYAIRLFNGAGITKDESEAAKLFRRAADVGNPIAQNRLGPDPGGGTRHGGRSG